MLAGTGRPAARDAPRPSRPGRAGPAPSAASARGPGPGGRARFGSLQLEAGLGGAAEAVAGGGLEGQHGRGVALRGTTKQVMYKYKYIHQYFGVALHGATKKGIYKYIHQYLGVAQRGTVKRGMLLLRRSSSQQEGRNAASCCARADVIGAMAVIVSVIGIRAKRGLFARAPADPRYAPSRRLWMKVCARSPLDEGVFARARACICARAGT